MRLRGAALARRFPSVTIVLNHLGGKVTPETVPPSAMAEYKRNIEEIAGCENVVCKISGIVVTANENWKPQDLAPNMLFCMETFGEDRAYFAGDWPVCRLRATFRQWVDALKWIVRDRPVAFQKKLFHDNATRFYRLD